MIDFIYETLLLLPFLFATYLVLEAVEAHAGSALERFLERARSVGPLAGALAAMKTPGDVLVEEYVPGRELTVGVIDGDPLPVIEIVAKGGWYGYHETYESEETRYPFLEDGELSEKLKKTAVDAFNAVGCRGVTRVDFRVSPLGRCYVLELNTSPGFTWSADFTTAPDASVVREYPRSSTEYGELRLLNSGTRSFIRPTVRIESNI